MAPDAPAPVRVRLGHVTAGRARLRLAQRLDRPALDALADRLAGLSRRAGGSWCDPSTGSVIVEAAAGEAALRRLIEGLDFLKVLPPEKPVPDRPGGEVRRADARQEESGAGPRAPSTSGRRWR